MSQQAYFWDFTERKCSQCGKNICMIDPNKWTYKRTLWSRKLGRNKTLYFCSWKCMRAWENKTPEYKNRIDWTGVEETHKRAARYLKGDDQL